MDYYSFQVVKSFLQSRGWSESDSTDPYGLVIFETKVEDERVEIRIADPEFEDADEVLARAIPIIAIVEEIPESTLRLLFDASVDRISLRLLNPETPSLSRVADAIHLLKEALGQTAVYEYDGEPVGRSNSRSKSFVEACRFAHTERQSFSINIDVPIPDQPELPGVEAFERRVVARFEEGFRKVGAFNANTCESILEIDEKLQGESGYEFVIVRSNLNGGGLSRIEVTNEVRHNLHRTKAIQQAKAEQNTTTEIVHGPIIELRYDPDSLGSETGPRGIATVYWQRRGAHALQVIVEFPSEEMERAFDVMRSGRPVHIEGQLGKRGNRYFLEPTLFALPDENEIFED